LLRAEHSGDRDKKDTVDSRKKAPEEEKGRKYHFLSYVNDLKWQSGIHLQYN